MTREMQQWEAELKAAGWRPTALHPNSPTWRAPDGVIYAGPGYAHTVMKQMEEQLTPIERITRAAQLEAERQSTKHI